MMIAAILLVIKLAAQSGTAMYSETMKLEIHLDGMDPGMEDMLPKERKVNKLLYFTPEATLFVNQEGSEDEEVSEEMAGGGTMVIKMEEPDERYYFDVKKQEVIEQRDFMSRMFLIESSADTLPWKLTGNRKEILGYSCMEAYYLKDSSRTVAWFAPAIPVSSGPGSYCGLPGLILEVNVNDGKRVIVCTSISMGEVADKLEKPKQGKKVSKEEFRAIVEEKTGQMNEGEGGVFMIKITR